MAGWVREREGMEGGMCEPGEERWGLRKEGDRL